MPAAGGQAAGLQRVELADNLIGVAPHGTCVHRNELNLVVGVDQERRAVAEAFAVDYANLLQDLVGRVGAQRMSRSSSSLERHARCTYSESVFTATTSQLRSCRSS